MPPGFEAVELKSFTEPTVNAFLAVDSTPQVPELGPLLPAANTNIWS
jgi:hypothetical protein